MLWIDTCPGSPAPDAALGAGVLSPSSEDLLLVPHPSPEEIASHVLWRDTCPGGPTTPIPTPRMLFHVCFEWTCLLERMGPMRTEGFAFPAKRTPGVRISPWSPIPAPRRQLHTCFGCTRVPEGLGFVHCHRVALCQPGCLPLFGPSPIPARISSWCPIPAPRRLLHACFGWTSILEVLGPMQLEYSWSLTYSSPFSDRQNLPRHGKKGLRTVFVTHDRHSAITRSKFRRWISDSYL